MGEKMNENEAALTEEEIKAVVEGEGLPVKPADVLNALFEPDEDVCFRIYDDKKRGLFPGAKLSCKCGRYAQKEDILKEHNAEDHSICFVVNFGGQDDASIERINAQFVEMDSGSFSEQYKKIKAFPIPPSMIIRTQKSLHVYWFMDKSAKVSEFRKLQKRLVKYFDGDPACVNESRAMRLPGFNHCKLEKPVKVVCIGFHPERRYTQEQLAEVLPDEEPQPVIQKSGSAKGLATVMQSCDFIKHCRENAATLSEPEWYAMITNLADLEGGTALIHDLSKAYPDYDKDKTQKKINHYLESRTKPMTCQTICEKGFACPKFKNGECQAGSPAALIYTPLSSEVLQSKIDELPITGNVINDLKAAESFINDYMYNQEEVTAEAIIYEKLIGHFRLQQKYARSLISVYKNASKAYQSNTASKKAAKDSGIPDWYNMTSTGLRFLPGVLGEHMAKSQNIIYATERFLAYNDGVYQEMPEKEAEAMVQKEMLVRERKMSQITDATCQWRLLVQHTPQELNVNPYIINLKNGLYNVLDDTFSPHSPKYLSTTQLNVAYNKDADCPLFKKFLCDSMDGNMAQVNLIQEIFGYCLIPVNHAQKSFVFVGPAAAGKSVCLRVLNDLLLGRENVSNISWQALNEHFKPAELFGKLANIFADLPTKNIEDTGNFKALVGEDYMTVEKKYKDPFQFLCTARFLFSCNNIPKNYNDRSEGFYRRLIIIRFAHSVPQEKRDPDLLDKFRAEADGIFLFALEGLHRLMNNNYVFSETQENYDELEQYRIDSDSVLSFVADNCVLCPNEDVRTGSKELFLQYQEFCKENGLRAVSQQNFSGKIVSSCDGVERGRDTTGKRRVLIGIRLKDPSEW